MKNRVILAAVLIVISALFVSIEFFYIKNVTETLVIQMDEILYVLSENNLDEIVLCFERSEDYYMNQQTILSLFVHDTVIDKIEGIFKDTEAYLNKQSSFSKQDINNMIHNIETIKMNILGIFESIVLKLKNLM